MRTFVIEQKITLLANQYSVYDTDEAGNKALLLGFAHQKRLAFKEKFIVYTGEDKQTELFTVQARSVIDLGARYEVRDAGGTLLGVLGKDFKSSLFRSTWHIFTPEREELPVCIIRERSQALALIRRVWELLPYIGDIPFFVKYHFDFTRPHEQTVLGSYNKTTRFRDHYRLTAEDALLADIDWRVLVALGIMLDALQSR